MRETLLGADCSAALALRRSQAVLDLKDERVRAKVARCAGEVELAAARFNDHGPLLVLDRFADARRLLSKPAAAPLRQRDGSPTWARSSAPWRPAG